MHDGTPERPQEHCHKTRRTLMSHQEHKIAGCTPKSTRDEAHFPCIGSIAILHSTTYTTSGLTIFRKLQSLTETPVSSLEEHQFQYSNSRKALCTPYCLEMRADSLSSTEEVSQLSTSTSRGVFPQHFVYERDPVFSASSRMDS